MTTPTDKIQYPNIPDIIYVTMEGELIGANLEETVTIPKGAVVVGGCFVNVRNLEKFEQQEARIKELEEAAKAVIDRWYTPLWKDVPATADYIHDLEKSIGYKGEWCDLRAEKPTGAQEEHITLSVNDLPKCTIGYCECYEKGDYSDCEERYAETHRVVHAEFTDKQVEAASRPIYLQLIHDYQLFSALKCGELYIQDVEDLPLSVVKDAMNDTAKLIAKAALTAAMEVKE